MEREKEKSYYSKANFDPDLDTGDGNNVASNLKLKDSKSSTSESFTTSQSLIRWILKNLAIYSVFFVILASPLGQLINRHGTTFFNNLLNEEVSLTKAKTIEPLEVSVRSIKAVKRYEKQQFYTGSVVSRRQTGLGFERTGKLLQVLVDEGDKVIAGQPLAQLDTRGLEAEMQQAIAQRDVAVARLKELKAGPRKESIDATRLKTERIAAQLQLARERYNRRAKLFSQGAISREQLDAALSEFKVAKASYKVVQRQLDQLLAGSRPEQIETQEALIRQLEAGITSIKVKVENSILKAPFSGQVSDRLLDEGFVFSTLTAGQPVLRIVEDNGLDVHVGIPAKKVAKLVKGKLYRLTIDGKEHAGTITNTLPILDNKTRSQTVVIALNTSNSFDVLPGQVARLSVTEMISIEGYWLPIDAITEDVNGLWSCYVLKQQAQNEFASTYEVKLKSIEVLHTDARRVFVRGTLQDKDLVITAGSHRLVPGQLVRPTNMQL